MLSIDKQIALSMERIAKAEHSNRVRLKKQKEIQKKKDQRRNYIIGELVSKYFPEVSSFEPGTKVENAVTFESLESFLSTLAADRELVNRIKNKTDNKNLTVTKSMDCPSAKCPNV